MGEDYQVSLATQYDRPATQYDRQRPNMTVQQPNMTVHVIKFRKTEITPVLEGFRTNQAHHSNRLGETESFGEKIRKSSHYIIRR